MNQQDTQEQQEQTLLRMEACIAGCILEQPERSLKLLPDYLEPEDCLSDACFAVLHAVRRLQKERKPINELSIRRQTELDRHTLGEEQYTCMHNMAISPEWIPQNALHVHQAALRRKALELAKEVLKNEQTDTEELLRSMAEQFQNLYSSVSMNSLTTAASSFAYEPPKWLVEPYFQRGKGTLIQADPGVGKTAFMCAVAAAVTTGRGFLGLTVQSPGNVVLFSVEDDPGVLRGRLESNGADLSKVFMVGEAYKLSLNSPEIERIIVQCNAKMIVFDPFQAFLGSKVDLFRANETRPVLAGLFEMCARHDCACVIIAHLGKNTTGKSAVNQSLGSVDIPGAMRSILHIVRDPRLPGQLMAVHIKSSNAAMGKTIAYSIGKRGSVNWLGLTDDTLETITSPKREEEKQSYEKNILLPVLLYMRDNNRQNCFWSYNDLREVCKKVIHQVPFNDAREVNRLLPREFLQELEARECIQLRVGEHYRNLRGLRLLTMPKTGSGNPDETLHLTQSEYQEMMNFLDQQEDWGTHQ